MLCASVIYAYEFTDLFRLRYGFVVGNLSVAAVESRLQLDKMDYDQLMAELANNATSTYLSSSTLALMPPNVPSIASASSSATSTVQMNWPVKAVYPNAGAILPFNRIVAYYGNFYSTGMGILGEYPPPVMLQKLQNAVTEWQIADPHIPVMPAIEYIAVTAQASPGIDGTYRLRMPDSQIQKAIELAGEVHGIVILDVQVGLSDLQKEIELLSPYLQMTNVELAIDPEFSMKMGGRPGSVVGTVDAADINNAAGFLATLVRDNNLPPKILIIHRYTEHMVTHYREIKPLPEVEIVMDMDGWGYPEKKIATYNAVIYSEPVQFAGIKIFYKNDIRPPSTGLLTPAEILDLKPRPIYIQYQ